MKINWKVRLKNPVFWLTLLPTAVTFMYTLLGSFGIVPSISEDNMMNIITAIVTALGTFGILVDPTTKGVSDSDKALTYEEPIVDTAEDDELEDIYFGRPRGKRLWNCGNKRDKRKRYKSRIV